MKKILALSVITLTLTNCASVPELRKDSPYFTAISTKPAKKVSECILFGWQEKWSGLMTLNIYIQPYLESGYTVYSNNNLYVADVIPTGKKTTVNFYYQGDDIFGVARKKSISTINDCL